MGYVNSGKREIGFLSASSGVLSVPHPAHNPHTPHSHHGTPPSPHSRTALAPQVRRSTFFATNGEQDNGCKIRKAAVPSSHADRGKREVEQRHICARMILGPGGRLW